MSTPPPGESPGSPVAAGDFGEWHRLHPLSPIVRAGRHLASILILVLILFFANHNGSGSDVVGNAVVIGLALSAGFVSWLVTRWQVADGVLRIETGLIRRESKRFPLSQVQAIDVVQTGLARVLGLADIRLRMAGADSSGGRLASLPRADAEQLRQQLLSMARATEAKAAGLPAAGQSAAGQSAAGQSAADQSAAGQATAGPGARSAGLTRALDRAGSAERLLFRVQSSRLAGAIALSGAGATAVVVLGAMAAIIAVTGKTGAIASILPVAVGVVLAVWRRFNSDFGTVVAAAPDGLRLRSGLVQTTAETIRPGRVQAVRLVEPLVWRAFGWCRLEVDVAGPRQRKENRSQEHRLRALIPVGSRAEADQMISELLSSRPSPTRRAPRSARWKAPLTYHFLAWGGDSHYVVASRGRISRKTTWVPLEKLQSVRWVQGPVQRRLGLASVRLDVAGKRVTANLEDRGTAEANEAFGRLPDLARRARARAPAA
jgi:putative membrane protein